MVGFPILIAVVVYLARDSFVRGAAFWICAGTAIFFMALALTAIIFGIVALAMRGETTGWTKLRAALGIGFGVVTLIVSCALSLGGTRTPIPSVSDPPLPVSPSSPAKFTD